MDRGKQAGGEDDTPELPSVPVERSAPLAEPDRLQLGKPLAAAGAAEEDRELVADQFAATAGEDGRETDQACAVLLADGRGASWLLSLGLLAESHLTRRLFGSMVRRIEALAVATG